MAFCTAISLCSTILSLSDFQSLLQHLACRFLVLIERMGIDVQRGRRLAVTQQACHRGHVRAVGNQQAGVGVPLRYNNDKPEKPRNFKGLEVYQADFSSFSNPKNQATKPLFRRGC